MSRRRGLWGLVLLVLLAGGANAWWSWHQASNLGSQLKALAKPGDIRMLSSTTCVFCARAREWMTQHQVPFTECFIETDRDCALLYEVARAPGTPVLLVKAKVQLGFSPERVADALTAAR